MARVAINAVLQPRVFFGAAAEVNTRSGEALAAACG